MFKVGDKVHYTNINGIYWGVFKVLGVEQRRGENRYFLENDGNPDHYSIEEARLRIAGKYEKLGCIYT